jgi:hypothetical protein
LLRVHGYLGDSGDQITLPKCLHSLAYVVANFVSVESGDLVAGKKYTFKPPQHGWSRVGVVVQDAEECLWPGKAGERTTQLGLARSETVECALPVITDGQERRPSTVWRCVLNTVEQAHKLHQELSVSCIHASAIRPRMNGPPGHTEDFGELIPRKPRILVRFPDRLCGGHAFDVKRCVCQRLIDV